MEEAPAVSRYLVLAIASVLALILVIFMLPRGVFAHDHEHPDLDSWYEGLHSRSRSPCCDGTEFSKGTAAHLEADEWETQDKENSHYRVNLDGKWQDVPDSAVVDGPNRDGRALVWFYVSRGYYYGGEVGEEHKVIRCFLPGTMS